MKSARVIFGAVTVLAITHGVFAGELTPEAVKRCAAVTDSLARLVCYDQLASGIASPAAATAPAPVPSAPAAAAAVVTAPVATSSKEATDPKVVPTSLTAKVESLQTFRASTYYIALDNGQHWQQEEMQSGFHLDVGDTVQIERGKMGGYKLAYVKDGKPNGMWVRVTRRK